MEAVFRLQVMLLGVSYGVETHCDGRQNGTQCYGALGGTVDIQLINSTSGIFRLQLMKNTFSLLTVRNNSITLNKTQEKSVFISSNGTFRMSNLNWTDSGNYNLQTFDANGTATGERILYLFIQAPVSSVLLVSECLSQGEMRVSCFSEGGDSPQYSWTLDGSTLTDAELLSRNNNIITLKQHVSGHLVCSVRNNVSDVSKEERISTCEAGILPLIGGVLSVLAIFLVVGVAVICAQTKKQNNIHPKKEEENDQEVSYSEIKIMRGQGQKVEQSIQLEVEYGQVRFSQGPRLTESTGDGCLYANVRRIK
ncbi:uncharacterized protein LOC115787177 [Archocentrus centrarchus]|uniref:uncharacterized protein LOC115787177 n=1 Tax=Archocentrus centrarchus TaxID=63155 RepID=UPI0011EA161D|nr:uncharacterized protein LOC115787177 [Archocentrus centrarchus]